MTDRSVVYKLQAEIGQFTAKMAQASASVQELGKRATAADKEGAKFRQGLDSLGNTAGKIGLVAAAGLGAAIKKAADFDQAMSNVQAATHESAAAMETLRTAALKAGADTAFSATEAAAGIENLAKAGISTQDILGGALAGSLDLAAAGGMEVADAAEAAAGAMAQFKLEGSEATHVADLLAAGAGKAQGDVSDMVMALKQAGTVSAQTGLSIEETTGSLAAMAEQSLLGSDAGTSFKTMLAALTPNSDKAAAAMEKYNIHAFDAQGNFIGMTELAGQLRAGLGGLTDEQRAMTMETIFGSDAVRAASIIYDNGADGIQSWIDKTDDAGYAAETAAIKLDNLKGDLEALGGSLETALTGTGEGSQGPLRSLTQGLTSAVNAYNDLGSGAKSGVAVALGATVALGGGLFVFSKMVQSVAATRLAMEQLGISATKTSRLMTGLGRAGFGAAALGAVALAAEQLRKAVEESLPGVSELSSRILDIRGGSVEDLGKEFDSLSASIARMDPGYIMRSSDAITSLLSFGILDGKEIDGARQEIESLDAALTNLATSGGSDVATESFEALAKAQGLSAAEQKELLSLLPGYKDALAANENQVALAADSTGDLANETAGLGDVMTVAEREADNLKNTLDGLNGVLDQRGNVRSYQAAIDDFTAGLKENGKSFDINTEKGRANQAALDGIASSALSVAEGLGTAARKKFLTNAITDLRTMGESMGLPKAEINRLIGLLEKANKTHVKPTIKVDDIQAMSAIERIRNAMLGIKDKSVTVRVTQTGAGLTPGFGPQAKAGGGLIHGPGTGTSDEVPIWASNKEYVVKAAAVEKYGVSMFDSLNAMRFAEGGSVDKRKATGGLFVADRTAALEEAIRRLTGVSEDQTKAVERETAKMDEWSSKMADVAAATVAGFNSDLFSSSDNPWAAGAGSGALFNLNKDIAGLQERGSLQAQLAAAGLSGDSLSALLSQGSNSDIASLLASGQVSQYASAYAQRAALQGSVGASAGQMAYGPQYAAAAADQRIAALAAQETNVQLVGLNNRLERMEQALANVPERVGSAAGGAVVNGGNQAARRRRRD